MKKIISLITAIILCFSVNVNAFELTEIKPDDSYINELGLNVQDDINYLDNIANGYAKRYVVKKVDTCDISDIDRFYRELSEPMTLEEIDKGECSFNLAAVMTERLTRKVGKFEKFGGLSGYTAYFEPICYYKIYRNITLVGGYSRYEKTYTDPYEAYWKCVCTIEDMTKEIVGYDTRMKMVEKIAEINNDIDNDKSFKIFILVDGKVNSMWERSETQ